MQKCWILGLPAYLLQFHTCKHQLKIQSHTRNIYLLYRNNPHNHLQALKIFSNICSNLSWSGGLFINMYCWYPAPPRAVQALTRLVTWPQSVHFLRKFRFAIAVFDKFRLTVTQNLWQSFSQSRYCYRPNQKVNLDIYGT